MPSYQIIYWRDIPTQIMIKLSRREVIKRMLDKRFIEGVDMAAMRGDAHTESDYLELWRKSDPIDISAQDDFDPEAFADQLQAKIEAEYPRERLNSIIKNDGIDSQG